MSSGAVFALVFVIAIGIVGLLVKWFAESKWMNATLRRDESVQTRGHVWPGVHGARVDDDGSCGSDGGGDGGGD
ncbi:MAG: hypothetical protein VYD64_02455 [Pseudomonadota bacterium]|nr:hypothetical protein [Pseudomonadota bacterium]